MNVIDYTTCESNFCNLLHVLIDRYLKQFLINSKHLGDTVLQEWENL